MQPAEPPFRTLRMQAERLLVHMRVRIIRGVLRRLQELPR